VHKITLPLELLFSKTLKGFLKLCNSYRVFAHPKVLSVLSFSVAQNAKGLNPSSTSYGESDALLGISFLINSLMSLQGIHQPREGILLDTPSLLGT
jgi:hypothetical protein